MGLVIVEPVEFVEMMSSEIKLLLFLKEFTKEISALLEVQQTQQLM